MADQVQQLQWEIMHVIDATLARYPQLSGPDVFSVLFSALADVVGSNPIPADREWLLDFVETEFRRRVGEYLDAREAGKLKTVGGMH